ncbi:Ku protein [Sinirhodobacter populi]|uniref:Non-homologous end joining protein Ku n=1 Tax=Paenirhodobacter populi TaxID=2306993 RepID=A0A443KNJ3_9RHOB|nr:Ku protein [Sinirhodobacter populi]RWR34482.1 Ku protein [Sinirhodobacter populi]
MAPKPFWKGYLRLSLVTCAISMQRAVSENAGIRFHTLNGRTGNRVVSRYVDAVTGKPVGEEDQVRGYPRGEDDYVMLEDDEIDSVALESSRTIDIATFVPADTIEWIWYDQPHYLSPDDPVGQEAFCVIRDAMAATGTVGISRLVLYRCERAVILEPRGKGIVLWTLRYGDEVRDPASCFEGLTEDKPEVPLMKLVKTLIKARTQPWDPTMVHDPVQDRLQEIITAKKKGRKRPAKASPQEDKPGNVVNILDALRRSIDGDGKDT